MRVMNAGMNGRFGSGTFIGVILPLAGLKSNSSIGELKTPPNVKLEVVVVLALAESGTCVGLSTLGTGGPGAIALPATVQPSCSPAVDETLTTAEPAVVVLERTTG